MIDMRHIGAQIAELRKNGGMTQTELAERLGVTHQAVSKWERGVSLPDLPTFAQLALLLGVPTDVLLGLVAKKRGDGGADSATNKTPEPEPAAAETEPPAAPGALDAEQVWNHVKAILKTKITWPSYNTWIRGTKATVEDGLLVIHCGSPFQKDWLYRRYLKMILQALEHVTGLPDIKIGFRSPSRGEAAMPADRERAKLLD
ncbi:helix-turn-helix domain-containing protein [Paenibacillus sp. GYB003]|uniref:helix-turn-helix domain-containing protein n=1 Tax=Paenibacillus sp. GYB003 TaxID=2994392 RepID=UPI002F968934